MGVALLAGGGRARPRLCLAVAEATGAGNLDLATAYAIALELAHAASLVHDDLPAFDDAAQRRGRPTVHVLYGVPTAVLVGDGLLVASFDVLARTATVAPDRVARALGILARALGAERGLVAGQAWESEVAVDLDRYHHAKTGGLFEAAACLGALSSGADVEPFRAFGARIGHAYQTADDLLDATGTQSEAGKPVGLDERHGRPSAARTFGVARARANLSRMVAEAIAAIPPAADRAPLVRWVDTLAAKMR